MDGQESYKNQGIQVISRAADILRLLGRETGGLSLGQIARDVQLPRSTVQRIVSALTVEGFVSSEGGYGGIRLGPQIQNLAQASASQFKDKLWPIIKQISEQTGETVDLAVFEGDHMRFVDQIVGTQRLRTASSVGDSFPLTTTANGKAALACLDITEVTKLSLAELSQNKTQKRPLSDLLAEIEAIRAGGLAQDINEHTEGVSAIGFAVKAPNGEIYAISVPVPSSRFERIKHSLSDHLSKARAQI